MLGLLMRPAFRRAVGLATVSAATGSGGLYLIACEDMVPPGATTTAAKIAASATVAAAANPEDVSEEEEGDFLEDTDIRYAGYAGRIGRVLATTAKSIGGNVRCACPPPCFRLAYQSVCTTRAPATTCPLALPTQPPWLQLMRVTGSSARGFPGHYS